MNDFLDKLHKVTVLVDLLNAAAAEFVDPNTPDDKNACINAAVAAFEGFGFSVANSMRYGKYFADIIEACAGGKDAVPTLMTDFNEMWYSYVKSAPPQMLIDLLHDFFVAAEQALVEFRQGKPLSG